MSDKHTPHHVLNPPEKVVQPPPPTQKESKEGVAHLTKTVSPVTNTPGGLVTNPVDAPAVPTHYKVPPVHGTPIPGTTVPAAACVEEREEEHTDTVGTSASGKISAPSDVEPDTEEQLHQDHKKKPVEHEGDPKKAQHTNHPAKK